MIRPMLRLLPLLFALPLAGCLTFLTEHPGTSDDDDAVDDDDVVDDDDAADDADQDGWTVEEGDCDDGDPARHPGADEECDGVDSNCDGVEDTDLPGDTWYRDFDNDGFGGAGPDASISACVAPPGYVDNDRDCADTNASVHPDAPEVCNGMDDDCDGDPDNGVLVPIYFDTDDDGHGSGPALGDGCPGPGYSELNDDCNDGDPTIWEDDDVDGDNDGWDRCAGDCDDADPAVNPAKAELCDGIDNDCSGGVDDGFVRVGVVHGASTGTGTALKFQLDSFGYCADIIAASSITAGTVFPYEYAALAIVHSTTTESAGWTAPVDPFLEFHDRCLPTIGMGSGGLALFDALAQTGFPTDLTFASSGPPGQRVLSPYSQSASIWWNPNQISSIFNNYVQPYTSGQTRPMVVPGSDWVVYGYAQGSPSSRLLLRENNCGKFWFWGWDVGLGSATQDGKHIFENLMYEATGGP